MPAGLYNLNNDDYIWSQAARQAVLQNMLATDAAARMDKETKYYSYDTQGNSATGTYENGTMRFQDVDPASQGQVLLKNQMRSGLGNSQPRTGLIGAGTGDSILNQTSEGAKATNMNYILSRYKTQGVF